MFDIAIWMVIGETLSFLIDTWGGYEWGKSNMPFIPSSILCELFRWRGNWFGINYVLKYGIFEAAFLSEDENSHPTCGYTYLQDYDSFDECQKICTKCSTSLIFIIVFMLLVKPKTMGLLSYRFQQ